jgi:geranylgeranyl reductase family protein
MDSEVLVIGGGPAGSSVAFQLARQGIDVCVLEKYHMPRYKTCGGGVNVRAARHIPFSIDPIIERTISRYRFTFRGEHPFVRSYPEPLTYMTQRMRLDKYLLDQARTAGARVVERVTARNILMTSDEVQVTTDSGERFKSSVIVGADGANSVVARDLGLMGDLRREIALESEIELPPEELQSWKDTIEIDLFPVFCGYGWVFPKDSHVSIGVGGMHDDIKTIQQYNKIYLERHNLATRPTLRFSGHALPVRRGRASVVRDRGLLVGDAAGLLEPFTGEGIGYAIRSGQLAADTIVAYLRGETPSLLPYGDRLDGEVTPQLLAAERFVRIFNRYPRLFYRLIRHSDSVWSAICLILRGERNFTDINRRLGIFHHALALL